MKTLVIDKLSNESKYRIEFWSAKREKFKNSEVDIPTAIKGDIVKQVFQDGKFEKIELDPYDLILIHERDDRKTGYEGTAVKKGKNVIVYSDAFEDIPVYEDDNKHLKIKGSILYSRLSDFIKSMEKYNIVDLKKLQRIDDQLENCLQPFEFLLPLKEYWTTTHEQEKIALNDYIRTKYV